MKIGITVGVVIAILALIASLVPLKEVAYTVTVPYQDIETYYVDEPYEVTETYYEAKPYEDTETYTETVPLDYHIVKFTNGYQPAGVEKWAPFAWVTLLNADTTSGEFFVHFYLTVEGFIPVAKDRFEFRSKNYQYDEELYLEPGEVGTAKHVADSLDEGYNARWRYEVTPGSKTIEKERTVTKYRQVEKERTVTKYRQVEKQRTVWKERLETRYKKVTLLDYLLHY